MSITVSDCLKLPALREGVVAAGEEGLSRIVNNISVLEITSDRQIATMEDTINNFEICLTSFAGIADDVPAQCRLIRYLSGIGDVGLIIYYVGIVMKKLDPQVLAVADELGFPLILMPPGKVDFRYSEAIRDVSDLLFKDRASAHNFYNSLAVSLSGLPESRRTLANLLKIASDTTRTTILISDASHLNTLQSSWPVSNRISLSDIMELFRAGSSGGDEEDEMVVSEYLGHVVLLFRVRFLSYKFRHSFLYLMDESSRFSLQDARQIADLIQLMAELWALDENEMADSCLVDAVMHGDQEQILALAQKYHVYITKFNTLLCVHPASCGSEISTVISERLKLRRILSDFIQQNRYPALLNAYDDYFVIFLQFDADTSAHASFLSDFRELVRAAAGSAAWLPAQYHQMKAMLRLYERFHIQAEQVFPKKACLRYADLLFVSDCAQLFAAEEPQKQIFDAAIETLKKLPDAESLLRTLTFYYLDADCRITETAQAMYLHRNTVKYRLNKVHNLLQVRLGNPADLHFMQRLSGYYRLYSVS